MYREFGLGYQCGQSTCIQRKHWMFEPTSADGLSPLDQIRLVEAEITRKIIAAHESSEHNAANARIQAALLKKQAEENGKREGQIRFKETIAKAEEQAEVIIAQAQHEADDLRENAQARMEQAVNEALNIVLGMKGGGKIDES
jgi:vacuolar-type H+-ATPase subunit H